MTRVTCIIVAFNDCAALTRCVASLYSGHRKPDEVIVVDNGSEKVIAPIGVSAVLDFHRNLGFARAVNRAAKIANGDLLVLVNPDTILDADSLSRLVEFADSKPAAILGGSARYADGQANPLVGGPLMSVRQLLGLLIGAAGRWHRSSEGYEYVAGCLLAIQSHAWQTLAGFDERYFMYFEDMDLCKRARSLDMEILVLPDVTYVHHGGRLPRGGLRKCTYYWYSCLCYMHKHWTLTACLAGSFLITAWWGRRMIVGAAMGLCGTIHTAGMRLLRIERVNNSGT